MMIDASELKAVLLEVMSKVREQSKLKQTPVGEAYLNSKWELLDLLLLFISKKESVDMQKLKSDLIKQVIDLKDLAPITKHSYLEDEIKAAAEILDPGQAGVVATDKIKWGHFSAKVSQMRIDGKLPNNITVSRRGEKFYLVKLPQGQVVKSRARTR